MSIKDVSSCNVITIDKDDTVKNAAILMKENNIGSVVVVNDRGNDLTPCGIITDRDIVTNAFTDGVDVEELKVAEIMSDDLLFVKQSEAIGEVIRNMSEKGVRRAPIVDDDNKVVGIASVDDLILLISEELHELSGVIQKQIM